MFGNYRQFEDYYTTQGGQAMGIYVCLSFVLLCQTLSKQPGSRLRDPAVAFIRVLCSRGIISVISDNLINERATILCECSLPQLQRSTILRRGLAYRPPRLASYLIVFLAVAGGMKSGGELCLVHSTCRWSWFQSIKGTVLGYRVVVVDTLME
jgi:hypothetical protein